MKRIWIFTAVYFSPTSRFVYTC